MGESEEKLEFVKLSDILYSETKFQVKTDIFQNNIQYTVYTPTNMHLQQIFLIVGI
jgi:hypothetical protein